MLPKFDVCALNEILVEPASEFGFETDLWTIGRLRQVIQDRYGVTICTHTVWRRLRDAGFTYQKPERQYFELNEEAREEWMREEAPRIRAAARKFQALLYLSGRVECVADGDCRKNLLTQRKLESMSKNPSLLRGLFFRCCVADFFK